MMDTNSIWKKCISDVMAKGTESSPRGKRISELLGYSYSIQMQSSVITLASRKMNYGFMLAEAAWIVSGSNWLDDITPYMKRYSDFSDDGIMLHGAYGPKVVDQLMYVVNCIENDIDTRQAVINIWREKPGISKDIPCTLNMQFLVRNDRLHCVTNMRSQDAVLGMSYDVFTFSMVANMVRILLANRGINVGLGVLHVNVGSFHIYQEHFGNIIEWIERDDLVLNDGLLDKMQQYLTTEAISPRQFIKELQNYAKKMKGRK